MQGRLRFGACISHKAGQPSAPCTGTEGTAYAIRKLLAREGLGGRLAEGQDAERPEHLRQVGGGRADDGAADASRPGTTMGGALTSRRVISDTGEASVRPTQAELRHARLERRRLEAQTVGGATLAADAPAGRLEHTAGCARARRRAACRSRPAACAPACVGSVTCRVVACARIMARSMTLRSSRTLPGQW